MSARVAGSSVPGERNECQIAAHGRHHRGGVDLVERQDITVVMAQYVVRCQSGFAHCARLRVTIRGKVANEQSEGSQPTRTAA